MRSLGISIARQALSAFVWEQSLLASKVVSCASVPCAEPFGGAEDFRRLSEEIRRATGGNGLPPAVVSIPPSWTYLRRIQLPVPDLPRARKMHVTELEGNLPIDDGDILSDLLPPPREGEPGRHLAVAARRSAVEKTAAAILDAGFQLDRVVTDHISILCGALAAKAAPDAMIVSFLGDVVVLRLSGGAVLRARQFPADAAGIAPEIQREIAELIDEGLGETPPVSLTVLGDVPAPLAVRLAGASRIKPPGDGAAFSAYGAALVPFSAAETGGFSLRTSAATDAERTREKRRVVIAAAAAAVAVIAAAGAIEMVSWAEGRKAAQVRALIRKEFLEAVPGVKTVVRETVQMKEKLQSLARQQKELGVDVTGPYGMLETVSKALPQRENISVREVSYDSGRMRIVGEAASSALVETFRAALAGAFGPGTGVTVQEAGGAARGGTVRFTILVEKNGGRRAS